MRIRYYLKIADLGAMAILIRPANSIMQHKSRALFIGFFDRLLRREAPALEGADHSSAPFTDPGTRTPSAFT
jgi:hypothetical protein